MNKTRPRLCSRSSRSCLKRSRGTARDVPCGEGAGQQRGGCGTAARRAQRGQRRGGCGGDSGMEGVEGTAARRAGWAGAGWDGGSGGIGQTAQPGEVEAAQGKAHHERRS